MFTRQIETGQFHLITSFIEANWDLFKLHIGEHLGSIGDDEREEDAQEFMERLRHNPED